MRTLVVVVALLAVAGAGMPAGAEIGAPDVVPAATLLLPYFEVDLADDRGLNTLLSINNASDEAVLAFVTVWSEWWVPILGFNVYLTGYDVQTISLRDLLVNGDLPNTGPSNVLSSLGQYSIGPHSTFGGTCSSALGSAPNYFSVAGSFLELLQQSLTGQARNSDGLCTSSPGRPTRARGFITVDTVRACTNEFPSDPGYFVDGGAGTATNQNVLWGDYFLIDPARNLAHGFTLVHIEADGNSLAQATTPCAVSGGSPTTFYCALRNPVGQAGEDNREGLPSVYATRYLQAGYDNGVFPPAGRDQGLGLVSGLPGQVAHAGLPPAGAGRPGPGAGPAVEGTDLLVWRDKNGAGPGAPRACDDPPPPLSQEQVVAFDEEENPVTLDFGEERPFPYGANRVRVGIDLPVGAGAGWLFLNLNQAGVAARRQAFVATAISAEGWLALGLEAIALNSLTRGPGGLATPRDNRRGLRNVRPTLAPPPNADVPTLFGP